MVMKFKWKSWLFTFLVVCSWNLWAEAEYDDELFYEKLINYLYTIYPDFGQKLFEYNGTDFGVNTSVHFKRISKGFALQAKTDDGGYSVFLSSTHQKSLDSGGRSKTSDRPHSMLYKCKSATNYCSGNPGYCMYVEGDPDTKIIITSPHAGPLNPKSIPDRDAGCWESMTKSCIYKHDCEDPLRGIKKSKEHCQAFDADDSATTDIAEVLVKSIARVTGSRPHLIINRLHRAKLDVNRDINLGAFGVDEAEHAYNDFHNYIKDAKKTFGDDWGLLLDIHGNNRGNWTMLGYGMYKYQMEEKPLRDASQSSIRALAQRSNTTLEDLIRGNNSLGHFLEEAKCQVFPSPDNPSPMNKAYLTGGYITRHHGSKDKGNIDAIQVEIPNAIRDNPEEHTAYIAKLTKGIVQFIDVNYKQHGNPVDNKNNDTGGTPPSSPTSPPSSFPSKVN